MNIHLRIAAMSLLIGMSALVAGCSSKGPKEARDQGFVTSKSDDEIRRDAAALYLKARESLDTGDYQQAADMYAQLSKRYPFTEYATQSDLDRIYALYRSYDPDKALAAAEKFLREHPRHPEADYAQYMKAMINFNRNDGMLDLLPLDGSQRDVSYERTAFDDFALLVQKYPNSRYVADARQRMIYLRNRIADHEYSIVEFYMRRGAYLAAAKRAEQIIAQYPGSPASYRALDMLVAAYRDAGLQQQADDAQALVLAQPARVDRPALARPSEDGERRHLLGIPIPFTHAESVAVSSGATPTVEPVETDTATPEPQAPSHAIEDSEPGLLGRIFPARPPAQGEAAPAAEGGEAADSAAAAPAATDTEASSANGTAPEKSHAQEDDEPGFFGRLFSQGFSVSIGGEDDDQTESNEPASPPPQTDAQDAGNPPPAP